MPRSPVPSSPAVAHGLDRTPLAWRAGAIAVLAGGLAIGDRLARARTGHVLLPSALSGALGVAVILRAGGRPKPGPVDLAGASAEPEVALPWLDVLIPARDEARAVPALVASLACQDLRCHDGSPAFSVIVVDDRSVDGTADAVRLAACQGGLGDHLTVVRREPGSVPDGKGAALAAVPDNLLRGEALVVLDADARIEPGFLRGVATLVAGGSTAFTLRRRTYHSCASVLAAAQAAELDVDGLQMRARIALGGAGEFRGNGMALTREALGEAGGWAPGSLTEDLELATRLASEGHAVDWHPQPVAWEAPTAGLRALARQRLRWSEGSLRRLFELLAPALLSRRMGLAAKVDLAVYAGQALLPPVVLGAVIGGASRRRAGPAAAVLATHFGVALALSAAASREDADHGQTCEACAGAGEVSLLGRREVRAVLGGLVAGQWLLAIPVALVRIALRPGTVHFERTRDRLL